MEVEAHTVYGDQTSTDAVLPVTENGRFLILDALGRLGTISSWQVSPKPASVIILGVSTDYRIGIGR